MRVKDLVEELSLHDEDAEVFIETDDGDTIDVLTDIRGDSQGVYLSSDPDLAEREMR